MSKVNRVCEVGDSESGDYRRWVEGRSVGKRSRQSLQPRRTSATVCKARQGSEVCGHSGSVFHLNVKRLHSVTDRIFLCTSVTNVECHTSVQLHSTHRNNMTPTVDLTTVCPTRYRTRHFFNNFTTNEDIATSTDTHYRHTIQTQYRHTLQTHTTDTHYRHTLQTHTTDTIQTHTTDTFLFISHTTNALLFKFRCNIFIGVRIIKEMPGSVASGTHCIL